MARTIPDSNRRWPKPGGMTYCTGRHVSGAATRLMGVGMSPRRRRVNGRSDACSRSVSRISSMRRTPASRTRGRSRVMPKAGIEMIATRSRGLDAATSGRSPTRSGTSVRHRTPSHRSLCTSELPISAISAQRGASRHPPTPHSLTSKPKATAITGRRWGSRAIPRRAPATFRDGRRHASSPRRLHPFA